MSLKSMGSLRVPSTLAFSVGLALSISLAIASPAHAALGGDAVSVSADRDAFAGELRSIASVQYDLHEITSGALVVHEYVTRQGQVFAVTWQGPTPPDLRQLLGEYFPRFSSATVAAHQASPGVHRQFSIAQPDLVIQSSGRLRSFRGLGIPAAAGACGRVIGSTAVARRGNSNDTSPSLYRAVCTVAAGCLRRRQQ